MPTGASADKLCQMIDGKLAEDGKDTPNVQVVLLSSEPNCEFSQEDEGGKFLTVPVVVLEVSEDNDRVELGDEQSTDGSDLRRELDTLREENQALQNHVVAL